MLLKDILSGKPTNITPETTIKKAAEIMVDQNLTIIPVTKNRYLTGIISERDIIECIVKGCDTDTTTINKYIRKDIITAEPDTTIDEIVELMNKHHSNNLPVIEGNKLVGVITWKDIALHFRRRPEDYSREDAFSVFSLPLNIRNRAFLYGFPLS